MCFPNFYNKDKKININPKEVNTKIKHQNTKYIKTHFILCDFWCFILFSTIQYKIILFLFRMCFSIWSKH